MIKHIPDKKFLKRFATERGLDINTAEQMLVDQVNLAEQNKKEAKEFNKQVKKQSRKFARLAYKERDLWEDKAKDFYFKTVYENAEKEGKPQAIDAKTMLNLYDKHIEDEINKTPYYEDLYGDDDEMVENKEGVENLDVKEKEKNAKEEFESTQSEIKEEITKTKGKGNIQYNNYGTVINLRNNKAKSNTGVEKGL